MNKRSSEKKENGEILQTLGVGNYKSSIVILRKRKIKKTTSLYLLKSKDGISFGKTKTVFHITRDNQKEDAGAIARICLSHIGNDYYAFYTITGAKHISLQKARIATLKEWDATGTLVQKEEVAYLLPQKLKNGNYAAYFGTKDISIGYSKDLETWRVSSEFILKQRPGFFDNNVISIVGLQENHRGYLILYSVKHRHENNALLQVGAALTSYDNPDHVIWRSEAPLWELATEDTNAMVLGSAILDKEERIIVYVKTGDESVLASAIPHPFSKKHLEEAKQLKKFSENPIIEPVSEHAWESDATFNPAVYFDGKKVNFLYRAVGNEGRSVLGYASSDDGVHVNERLSYPVYIPRYTFESAGKSKPSIPSPLASGPGWGGCEDPKLSKIDDRLYMTYVAFDGWNNLSVALTSIRLEDFQAKKWQWDIPQVMAKPIRSERDGQMSNIKSACLLPQKINGKFVTFFRVFPDICINYRDELVFGEGKWLTIDDKISARPNFWDSLKISIGVTPIRTEYGWLVIYSGVDARDPRYKIGAMLLALDDPKTVLYRTNAPILVPDEWYENEGKAGIAYPSGAAIIHNRLFVYYGGGDRVTCVATAEMDDLLHHLMSETVKSFTLQKVNVF